MHVPACAVAFVAYAIVTTTAYVRIPSCAIATNAVGHSVWQMLVWLHLHNYGGVHNSGLSVHWLLHGHYPVRLTHHWLSHHRLTHHRLTHHRLPHHRLTYHAWLNVHLLAHGCTAHLWVAPHWLLLRISTHRVLLRIESHRLALRIAAHHWLLVLRLHSNSSLHVGSTMRLPNCLEMNDASLSSLEEKPETVLEATSDAQGGYLDFSSANQIVLARIFIKDRERNVVSDVLDIKGHHLTHPVRRLASTLESFGPLSLLSGLKDAIWVHLAEHFGVTAESCLVDMNL